MFYKTEYCLKYKDDIVFKFNIENRSIQIVNKNLLPISLLNKPYTFDLVKKFCSDRILMLNREHCKEILIACGIEEQSDISICVVCRGLSFRDNYWIDRTRSTDKWENVNLYRNKFSLAISRVALTGNINEMNIGDNIFTGELTNKGTRAKCYYRSNEGLLLFKHETNTEIASEIVTYYIAKALKTPCSEYRVMKLFDKECSVCRIMTSETTELIPCRDVMSMYNEGTMHYNGNAYKAFMTIDAVNFIKMQLLDYVVLNTDRNRDNFGMLRSNGKLTGLYPLFDHDSSFKGKGTNAVYFPSGLTFAKTLELLKTTYSEIYNNLNKDIDDFKNTLKTNEFKHLFLQYKTTEEYENMLNRADNL